MGEELEEALVAETKLVRVAGGTEAEAAGGEEGEGGEEEELVPNRGVDPNFFNVLPPELKPEFGNMRRHGVAAASNEAEEEEEDEDEDEAEADGKGEHDGKEVEEEVVEDEESQNPM